eukprot:GILK01002332.1.p1 GENE.GILK01002332.1~~GILK01002332.1.p1  ORF type:complete len:409 (+),score=75.17 GILK01002332.1:43-1227(+)
MAARLGVNFQRSEPEVFETPAVEEDDSNVITEPESLSTKTHSADIDRTGIKPVQSYEIFSGKRYEPDADFSDSLAKRVLVRHNPQTGGNLSGYGVQPTVHSRFESPSQRFQRLQIEVGDFMEDLKRLQQEKDSAATEESSSILNNLRALQQGLNSLTSDPQTASSLEPDGLQLDFQRQLSELASKAQQSSKEQTPSVDSTQPVTYELYVAAERISGQEASRFSLLESRIAELEHRIGSSQRAGEQADVHSALQVLKERVAMLDPAKVESIHKRVQFITTEIETLIAKRQHVDPRGPDDKKVESMFQMMERWDAAALQLPAVCSRLHSLKAIHEESASFSTRLAQLETAQQQILSLLQSDAEMLGTVRSTLQDNLSTIQKNMDLLNKRIQALSSS